MLLKKLFKISLEKKYMLLFYFHFSRQTAWDNVEECEKFVALLMEAAEKVFLLDDVAVSCS